MYSEYYIQLVLKSSIYWNRGRAHCQELLGIFKLQLRCHLRNVIDRMYLLLSCLLHLESGWQSCLLSMNTGDQVSLRCSSSPSLGISSSHPVFIHWIVKGIQYLFCLSLYTVSSLSSFMILEPIFSICISRMSADTF